MPTTYLAFLMNRQSREEFVAPVVAEDVATAKLEVLLAYPESRYLLQTIYSRDEIRNVLTNIERWPGLPSKIQPPLTTDLTKVTARTGGLPPLPGHIKAKVEEVKNNTQTIPGWLQGLQPATPAPVAQPQAQPQPQPQAQTQSYVSAPIRNTPAIEEAMLRPKSSLPQQSLIDRLRAARGETLKPLVMPTPSINHPAQPGSVIDILKSMRK